MGKVQFNSQQIGKTMMLKRNYLILIVTPQLQRKWDTLYRYSRPYNVLRPSIDVMKKNLA